MPGELVLLDKMSDGGKVCRPRFVLFLFAFACACFRGLLGRPFALHHAAVLHKDDTACQHGQKKCAHKDARPGRRNLRGRNRGLPCGKNATVAVQAVKVAGVAHAKIAKGRLRRRNTA